MELVKFEIYQFISQDVYQKNDPKHFLLLDQHIY